MHTGKERGYWKTRIVFTLVLNLPNNYDPEHVTKLGLTEL